MKTSIYLYNIKMVYFRKFVSEVLGYQFYDALCKLSSHEGDLNNCDISGSKKAGESLRHVKY